MMKFKPGQLVQTSGVAAKSQDSPDFEAYVMNCLFRHTSGDWGDLCEDDKSLNDAGVSAEHPDRLMSAYEHPEHPKVWIITEWDRSVTTVLFPAEY